MLLVHVTYMERLEWRVWTLGGYSAGIGICQRGKVTPPMKLTKVVALSSGNSQGILYFCRD